MKNFLCALTLMLTCATSQAASLGNCTVQYRTGNDVVTKQCFQFDQQENNGEFGIGVREDDLVIAFIGTVQDNSSDIVNVKLTKIYVNHITEMPKTEYTPVSEGFCKFRRGNAVECQSGDFMLNATY